MRKVTEGVIDAIVYPSITDKTKNRGFAFVEYESHRAAAMARRKLLPGRIQLWGQPIAVDWAEPEQEVDEDVMAKVSNSSLPRKQYAEETKTYWLCTGRLPVTIDGPLSVDAYPVTSFW